MKKLLIGTMSLVWIMGLTMMSPIGVSAQQMESSDLWGEGVVDTYTGEGFSEADPRQTISRIIKIGLGFLGSIAVILIVLAGFKWMTAAGNEDKIAESKKLMSAAVVGLVIILMAFALTSFVINSVVSAIK